MVTEGSVDMVSSGYGNLSPAPHLTTSSLQIPGWKSRMPVSRFHWWHQREEKKNGRVWVVEWMTDTLTVLHPSFLLTWFEPQVWCHLPPRRPLPRQQMPTHTATKVLPKPRRRHLATQQEAQPSRLAGRTWGENSNLQFTSSAFLCQVSVFSLSLC